MKSRLSIRPQSFMVVDDIEVVYDIVNFINPDVKRILVSAFEMHDDLFRDSHSIDKFLSKPLKMSELIEVVQQHVNKVEIKQNSR